MAERLRPMRDLLGDFREANRPAARGPRWGYESPDEEREAYDAWADAGPEEPPNPPEPQREVDRAMQRTDWSRFPMDFRWKAFEELHKLRQTGSPTAELIDILNLISP